jgi:hypothetical protein
MRTFAEQFTNSRAEFDFINVGRGKENADSKMRSEFPVAQTHARSFRLTDRQKCSTISSRTFSARRFSSQAAMIMVIYMTLGST